MKLRSIGFAVAAAGVLATSGCATYYDRPYAVYDSPRVVASALIVFSCVASAQAATRPVTASTPDATRAELTASAKDPSNKYLSAKVTNVVVNGDTATVTYDLNGRNFVLLGGSMGEAVKVGSRWLVSKKTYCQLITLQDSSVAHPGCS